MKEFQRELKLSFPVLFDSDGKVADKYQFRGHPATFLINRDGFLVGKVMGERDWASPEAKALIRELLKNNP